LIGIPFRVTVGPRGVEAGTVELTPRSTMETEEVALADCVGILSSWLG
jgi:prolyl-tRNA synthetase